MSDGVRVEPNAVLFTQTYISSTTNYTITVSNNTNEMISYKWCNYETNEEEETYLASLDIYSSEDRPKTHNIFRKDNNVFVPEILEGEIWPNRDKLLSIQFTPRVAEKYQRVLYLDIGQGKPRIPVTFVGTGLPPDAYLSIDTVNVGHISLESVIKYKISLINAGKVPVKYDLAKKRHNLEFTFSPSCGCIDVGAQQDIDVILKATHVGQFNENFEFKVQGSTTFNPNITFYGRVVGPDFLLSSKFIAFGNVSYGFMYTEKFEIENKSEIPFDFRFHFEQDTSFSPREFAIFPSTGHIAKFGRQEITIEFVPISVQEYNVKLCLDILNVGKSIEKIPITAKCVCPELSLPSSTIDFGKVFIGHEYIEKIHIQGHPNFPAKFECSVPEFVSTSQANIVIPKGRGVINANQDLELDIHMTPMMLGPINLQCHLRINGRDLPPIPFNVTALCTGPNINLSQTSVRFGTIPVLNDNIHKITMSNNSLIPAQYSINVQAENTAFRVTPREGIIEPNKDQQIDIIANLDDTIAFSGKIVINVTNLNPMYIDVSASGSGTPIVPSIDLTTVDFGFILNETYSVKKFTIVNHGRRSQELRWSRQKTKMEESAKSNFVFSITPETVVIDPHQKVEFEIAVEGSNPTNFSTQLVCNSTIGRQRIELFKSTVKGVIIRPLLSFSQQLIEFTHIHDAAKEEKILMSGGLKQETPSISLMPEQSATFEIKNLVKIPLNITIDTAAPFDVSPRKLTMEPGESSEITVIFNASFKQDFNSEVINKKIIFSFVDHPQKLFVNAKANYIFPNLTFSPQNIINFGNMMLNTEQTKEVKLTASSGVPVNYSWNLIADNGSKEITGIFDVFPMRGRLEADASEIVHFSFFAAGDTDGGSMSYSGKALCHIDGGPDYVLSLQGAAAAIKYTFKPQELNLGFIKHDSNITRQVVLKNLSDLSINFSTKISKGHKLQSFTVYPVEGTIPVDGTVTINVGVTCGCPGTYNEYFLIQIGHFEEIKIPVNASAYYPQVRLNVPRDPSDPALSMLPGATEEELSAMEVKILVDKMADRVNQFNNNMRLRRRESAVFVGSILSKYVFDVGEIIVGETKEFPFDITSITPYPISIEASPNPLKGTGFYMENYAISDLPENSTVQHRLIFDTLKRTNGVTGDVRYDLIFEFSDDLAFMFSIVACIKLPILTFNRMHFDFDEVIVGQVKTMTLQLQNMNCVACEFNIGECTPIGQTVKTTSQIIKPSRTQKNKQKVEEEEEEDEETPIYTTKPSIGVLPPATFQNIEISFIPSEGKAFQMQLPIKIKHNPQPMYITLAGTGIQLNIVFDPPSLILPPQEPYSDPTHSDVYLINPTNYPIEVFSYMFDFDLFVQSYKKPEAIKSDDTVTFTQNQNVSKFSICAIVYGPPEGGHSEISKVVSAHLKSPIINLSEVWAELLERETPPAAADFTAAFFARISQADCADGFVVDGLDCLKEPAETDQFMLQCIKQKNCLEDAIKNPFAAIPHSVLTAAEQALNIIINALDGHYVFFIGAKSNIDAINEHIEEQKAAERRRKRIEAQEEKDALFNMTEEQYMALTDEEKEKVDKKRKAARKRQLAAEQQNDQMTEENQTSRRRHRKHSESERSDKGKDKDSGKDKDKEKEKPVRKSKKPTVPTDPIEHSIMLFNLIVGSLTTRLRESCDYFQAINPNMLHRLVSDSVENLHDDTSLKDNNSIIIDDTLDQDKIQKIVAKFIPPIRELKENAFTSLIPAPRVEMAADLEVPKTMYTEAPSYFTIINETPLPELPPLSSEEDAKTGRRSQKSNASTRSKKKKQPETRTYAFDTTRLTTRWNIQPNSKQKIVIRFNPTSIGSFKSDLMFGISNCRCDPFKFNVQGVCSHPNIDRALKNIFTTKGKYSLEFGEFQFGPVLIAKEKTGKSSSMLFREKLCITNNSQFPSEVTALFSDTNQKAQWCADPPSVTIQPQQSADIEIGVQPTATDVYKNQVALFVKDQPDPMFINFSVEGCIPSIDIVNTNLDFGKLLLGQTRTLSIDLKNTSKLPSSWRLKNTQVLGANFTFNATEGTIPPNKNFVVKLSYSSPKPFNIKKPIQVEVLDSSQTRVFCTTPLNVIAESFDVTFDFQYPKGMDHLQYGFFKVGQSKSIQATLKNKGKFSINYQIKLEGAAAGFFTVTPSEGSLSGSDKPLTITFAMKTSRVVTYNNMKGIKLLITDPNTKTQTATLPIPFSAETVYSLFSIAPSRKVAFGALPVSNGATKSITIKNEGKFPFEFEFNGRVEDPAVAVNPKEKKKQPAPPKPRGKKPGPVIQIGSFSVSPSNGTLAPGNTVQIDIDFASNLPGEFRSHLNVKISDSDPSQKDESSIICTASTVIPGIEVSNFEKIFPGTNLCLSYDIKKMNRTAFLEDQQIMHFEPLLLQHKKSVDLALVNPFPVSCTVDMNIKAPKQKGSSSNFPFDIAEKTVTVEPNSKKIVPLTFAPVTSDSFMGFFEAVVRASNNENRLLKFSVEGVGALPQISIGGGMDHGKGNIYTSNLGRTLLGFTKEKSFTITNESPLPANVTLNVKPCPDFEINPNIAELTLAPQQTELFNVVFKPTKTRKGMLEIGLSATDNPKANNSLQFIAEGISEDVIFEGLSNDEGDIVFKDCIVGRQAQVVFSMKNVSGNDFRFMWNQQHELNFSPRVGHLRFGQTKEIVVTFFSDHAVKSQQMKAVCAITKMDLTDPNAPDWDDTMKIVKWVPKSSLQPEAPPEEEKPSSKLEKKRAPKGKLNRTESKKEPEKKEELEKKVEEDPLVRVIEVKPEPPSTLAVGKAKEISLKCVAVADVLKYSIDTTEIAFSPTMMFQARSTEVRMTNTCGIRLEYHWRVKKFESLRSDYLSQHPVPFVISPSNGFIEPGQTNIFKVSFIPEEVDDFVGELTCDVPFLSQQEPPVLKVSGLSRRPLCHFNVEQSDYLTRRHPDYTSKLPADIHVIEMFAEGIGKKCVKKFELINPTASPYEIKWVRLTEGESPVSCETARCLISSGKHSSVVFEFNPVSVKTIESLWEFQIPEHNVRVQFLFVGRIMPK